MSVLEKLKAYLDEKEVKYSTITHPQAYTAQGLAQAMHVPGREFAKSVLIKIDGKCALAVLPAVLNIDFNKIKHALGTDNVELANEDDIERCFPGCELGAMPPLGNLYDLPVFVARDLRDDEEIIFNAGSHVEAIRMNYADFEKLVQPVVCEFTSRTRAAAGGASSY
jgi:Ala-tRNA(Pro) deacylase